MGRGWGTKWIVDRMGGVYARGMMVHASRGTDRQGRGWGLAAGGLCVGLLAGAASGGGVDELAGRECLVGESVRVSGDVDRPAVLLLDIDQPGVLTVVVEGASTDAQFLVGDAFGQPLLGGEIDVDPPSLPRGEFGAVGIASPGRYTVIVLPVDEAMHVTAQVHTSFVALPGMVGGAVDPHGQPDTARDLPLGRRVEGRVSQSDGDLRDWYVWVPERDGKVVVRVSAYSDVDLMLWRYSEGRYWMSVESSDQDLNDRPGDESLAFEVRKGEAVYLRVGPIWALSEGEVSGYGLEAAWQDR